MAAITWNNVTDAFTEIAAATTNGQLPAMAQSVMLSIVNGAGISSANFGGEDADLTRDARILYAAHLATMFLRMGLGGGIASQSEGGVSQSYWNAWQNPRALMLTSYGQLLYGLISGTPARAGKLVFRSN